MGKRARAAREADAQRPFAGLKAALRDRGLAPTEAPARAARSDRPGTPPPAPAQPDAEAALFRREMEGSRRLRDTNRAELDRPRPAPIPRPRLAADEPLATTTRRRTPRNDAELFANAMADVQPLADGNRADLLPSTRYRDPDGTPRPTPDRPPDDSSPPEAWLDWAQAGAKPLRNSGRADVDRPKPAPHPLQRELDEASVLRESIETPLSFEDRLDIGDEAVFLRPGLPRRVLSDLRRGRWVVQRELDLHGLTRDEARQALATFLAACLADGKRCVRLIHGKGLGSPGGVGILKQLSRGWLAQREEVLAFCQARPHEGGSGALLILMRSGKARSGGNREPAGAT